MIKLIQGLRESATLSDPLVSWEREARGPIDALSVRVLSVTVPQRLYRGCNPVQSSSEAVWKRSLVSVKLGRGDST